MINYDIFVLNHFPIIKMIISKQTKNPTPDIRTNMRNCHPSNDLCRQTESTLVDEINYSLKIGLIVG